MFVDFIRIHARAGDGGNGASSFRRETFVPRGGPDGGDGGKGGDVILRTDPNVDTLAAFYYDPKLHARPGNGGGGRERSGKNAPDKIALVPPGTLVYRLPAHLRPATTDVAYEAAEGRADDPIPEPAAPPPRDLKKEDLELVADLVTPGEDFVLCKGGKGGKGNVHFKSPQNQAPTRADDGVPGEVGWFYLELRQIADVGLVGYPNAGKSTLLGAISAAHPKVAAYPFTTLHPNVGVVERPGWRRFTVADIPGLIDGAHRNVGLGHEFLRHVARCRVLLFVLDVAGSEGRDPLEDLEHLRKELKLYDPTLAARAWHIVANKADLPEAEINLTRLRAKRRKARVFAVSAREKQGIEELLAGLDKELGRSVAPKEG